MIPQMAGFDGGVPLNKPSKVGSLHLNFLIKPPGVGIHPFWRAPTWPAGMEAS